MVKLFRMPIFHITMRPVPCLFFCILNLHELYEN